MQELLSWQLPLGVFVGLLVAWFIQMSGYKHGVKDAIGRIMKVEEIPRNMRLQFRGRVGKEYFLFAKSRKTKDGLTFCLESLIAWSPGLDSQLDLLTYGNQFMVTDDHIGGSLSATRFLKVVD